MHWSHNSSFQILNKVLKLVKLLLNKKVAFFYFLNMILPMLVNKEVVHLFDKKINLIRLCSCEKLPNIRTLLIFQFINLKYCCFFKSNSEKLKCDLKDCGSKG